MSGHNALYELYQAPYKLEAPDSGDTVVVDRQDAIVQVTTGAGAFTLTLAQPTKSGIRSKVELVTDGGGDLTLTVTGGWNAAADTTMTLGDAGDFVTFVSIQVGSSYYWRVAKAEGVAEIYAEDIDVHALTALSAVPDAADLLAVSDESATSDPTRAVTVTELLSAIGDMTDLAAVPAVDDRIVLTDESATGDPAKSTTVENFFSALGDVTALGAAPDAADILGITDESAAGDPIKAVTVQQLFNTLGDLTDLAASPATDDRIPLTDESEAGDPAKSMTVANLFGTYFSDMTPGTGISTGTGTICEHRVSMINGIKKTEILIDLTGLNSGGAAGDIIGKDGGTANCHIGQITAAVNGTIVAGRVTCFETPAGGDPDVDIWGSVTEATGAQDAAISSLTGESQLINHADWTAGDTAILTALPAADGYLYLACGDATDADYTAGILLIELWGI